MHVLAVNGMSKVDKKHAISTNNQNTHAETMLMGKF